MPFIRNFAVILFIILSFPVLNYGQFIDNFDKDKIEGWFFFTGDGSAEMDFVQNNGYSTIVVNGTTDKYNVYWTLIKRDITQYLDLNKLKDTSYQLRVEAKVRVHDAPRRLNFMVNTNRTTDFHKDLMEYDIPDTTGWHIISMTTKKFDALPGDTVYVQLCATDYGLDKYYVDIDYYRADIVNVKQAGPDKGDLVPYHPAIPPVNVFSHHLLVSDDALLNTDFPDVNFNNWQLKQNGIQKQVLTVNGNQWAILKWDFTKFPNADVREAGLLELTTQSVAKGGNYVHTYGEDFGIEFGKVRVIEILGGDPGWNQEQVTYNNLTGGKKYPEVFNSQMIYDTDVIETEGGKNFITISRPVLQRLMNGTTKGLLIRPLGAIDVSFFASEDKSGNGPKLHFNLP